MSRKFGGKKYLEDDFFFNKKHAQKRVKELRNKGYNACFVSNIKQGRKNSYAVYKRKK
jgi:hypothetical protein